MSRTLSAFVCTLWLATPAYAVQAGTQRKPTAPAADRATLLQRAAAAQKDGRDREAMRLFQLAAERHQSVQACLELARMQSRAGDQPAALATLTRARALAPNSEEVLGAFAQVSLAAGRPLPAVLALRAMTRLYPSVPQYHYLLGVGLMRVGDVASAVEALNDANRLEPDHALTLLALGLALNDRKQYGEARTLLSRSLELQPDSADAVAALAEAEAGLGNLDPAAAHARRALERSPANATAHLVTGMVAMERREYAAARDALLKALAADPDVPRTAYQLSLVFARLGDDASARKYVELYKEKLRLVEERVTALRTGAPPPAAKQP